MTMSAGCVALNVAALDVGDWAQWRGPRGDGISKETGWSAEFPDGGPRIVWQQNVGVGYSSTSVSGNGLYTAGWNDGHDAIVCLDTQNGEVVWRHTYESKKFDNNHKGGPASTPAVDAGAPGRVYFVSRDGRLFCLNAESGDPFWIKSLTDEFGVEAPSWGFSGSPFIDRQTLYIDAGRILAIDKLSGDLRWKSDDYGVAYSTPVPFNVDDRRLIAAYPVYGLVIIDPASGREVAKYEWRLDNKVNVATPVIDGNRLFVSSNYDKGGVLLELAGDELRVLWETRRMSNWMATCVVHDGNLFGFDKGVIRCLDLATGQVQWSQRGLGKGTLMAADGRLIIMSASGELIIADATPNHFAPSGRAQILEGGDCSTVPVLAGGRIYCRATSGQVVCVDVTK